MYSLTFFLSLNDLAEFIKVTDVGLTEEVAEGDYTGLVDVMGHLMAVKDRSITTDEMFEPLKHTIELLRSYDQEMSEETHSLLQVVIALLLWKDAILQGERFLAPILPTIDSVYAIFLWIFYRAVFKNLIDMKLTTLWLAPFEIFLDGNRQS